MNSGRINLTGAGTYTSSIVFGGAPPSPGAVTEVWNGTSWTEQGDLAQSRKYAGGAGADNTSGLAFGGNPAASGANLNDTELWTGAGAGLTRTFTDS